VGAIEGVKASLVVTHLRLLVASREAGWGRLQRLIHTWRIRQGEGAFRKFRKAAKRERRALAVELDAARRDEKEEEEEEGWANVLAVAQQRGEEGGGATPPAKQQQQHVFRPGPGSGAFLRPRPSANAVPAPTQSEGELKQQQQQQQPPPQRHALMQGIK